LERFASFRRPGAWLVDVIPELEKVPIFDLISPWKKRAAEIFQKDSAVYEAFWKEMKREVAEGTAPHSWGKEFVQSDYTKYGVDEMGAIYTAYISFYFIPDGARGSMIEAGSETTSQILNNTIVGLLSNPEIIGKCHEELDRVVGGDRTPTMDDIHDLNYIRSLVKVIASSVSY
jgi:Cytochrome P450